MSTESLPTWDASKESPAFHYLWNAAEEEINELRREREELLRELALAECQIEAQQRQLVAIGVLDPELGP